MDALHLFLPQGEGEIEEEKHRQQNRPGVPDRGRPQHEDEEGGKNDGNARHEQEKEACPAIPIFLPFSGRTMRGRP